MRFDSPEFRVKVGLAEMLKGGVIMDVTDASQASIAEEAGAAAVMALAAEWLRPRLNELTEPGVENRILQVIQLGIAVAFVSVVYFAAAWMLRIPEATRLLRTIDRRAQQLTRRDRGRR